MELRERLNGPIKTKILISVFWIFLKISKFLNHKMAKGDGLLSGIKNLEL